MRKYAVMSACCTNEFINPPSNVIDDKNSALIAAHTPPITFYPSSYTAHVILKIPCSENFLTS
jgi:hypothetical protein